MKKLIALAIYLLSLSVQPLYSQQIESHLSSLSLNYLQIKEGLNYGLVFQGPGIHYTYAHQKENEKRILRYEIKGGFNYLEANGIGGGNIRFVPVILTYLFKTGSADKFQIGPFFTGEYNYALYPDLNSGYSFWFTHYSLGGEMNYPVQVGEQLFSFRLRTTLFGITSRPPLERDPYFFDLSVGDAINFLHQDFQTGGWNHYKQSDLEIRWHPSNESRIGFSYTIQFTGYNIEPKFNAVDHVVKIIFLPKNKSK